MFGNGYSIINFKNIIKLKRKIEKANNETQKEIISKLTKSDKNLWWVREYLGNQYFKEQMIFRCELCDKVFHREIGLHNHKKIYHKL